MKIQKSTTNRSSKESTLRMSDTYRSQSTKSIRAQRILLQKELKKQIAKESQSQAKTMIRKSSLKRTEHQKYNSDLSHMDDDQLRQYEPASDLHRVKIQEQNQLTDNKSSHSPCYIKVEDDHHQNYQKQSAFAQRNFSDKGLQTSLYSHTVTSNRQSSPNNERLDRQTSATAHQQK